MLKRTLIKFVRSLTFSKEGCITVDDIVDGLISIGIQLSRWISVEDILPVGIEEHYQQYGEYPEFNVMIAGGRIPTTLFFDGEGWFDTANEYYKVTHWLPLPPAPGVCNV